MVVDRVGKDSAVPTRSWLGPTSAPRHSPQNSTLDRPWRVRPLGS